MLRFTTKYLLSSSILRALLDALEGIKLSANDYTYHLVVPIPPHSPSISWALSYHFCNITYTRVHNHFVHSINDIMASAADSVESGAPPQLRVIDHFPRLANAPGVP